MLRHGNIMLRPYSRPAITLIAERFSRI